ncbi:hypothetical protein ES703_22393 [subsurface metagenome]
MKSDNAMKIFKKMWSKQLFGKDLETFLEVLKHSTNKSEYAEDELYGWEKVVQVNLKDAENFYLKVDEPFAEHPKLVIEQGNADSPDTTIITDGDTLTGIISGRIRLSQENSELFKVKGDQTQGSIIFILLMIIGQEFVEQERQAEAKRNGKKIKIE